jgi:hypothetical protein
MNSEEKQNTESITDSQQSNLKVKRLHQYLNLVQASLERYEYLKKSGVPDVVLFIEKGLIDRQMLFMSKAFAQLEV